MATAPIRLSVDEHVLDEEHTGALPVVSSGTPRFAWVVPLERNGQRQTAWQLRASACADPRDLGDLWDSGVVAGEKNSDVLWGGAALAPFSAASWTVRTTDEAGVVSEWAKPMPLLVGPLVADDWTAQWIEFPATHAARMQFELPSDLERATLHFAAAGVVRAIIDGAAVNADALDPTDSSMRRAVSRSYDVTALLDRTASRHTLALVATLGHYGELLDRPRLLAELHVQGAAGTVVVPTSGAWVHSPTSVVADEAFYLEEHDARLGADWATARTLPTDAPVSLVVEPVPPRTVTPDAGPPVRVVRRITAAQVGEPAPGVRVFDLGENVAGRVSVALTGGLPGVRVVIAHGEKVDAAGRVDSTNIRLPTDRDRERQLLAWTTAGSADRPEVITPWFAVHGFRYVEVRGLTTETAEVSVGVIHSAIEQTGHFASAEPLLDRLVDMAVRTQLNNVHGLPEDCPGREQSGWTGDAVASAEAALAHLDMAGVYDNWLVDVALDARGGGVLGISPLLHADVQPADPVWGAAMTEIPWQRWWATGDLEPARRMLPAMRAWADWQLGTLENGIVRHAEISFGADWLALEQTPPVLLQTAAVIRSLRALADLEDAAGEAAEAARRRAEADRIVVAARRELHDPLDAQWANGSQASLALALVTGLAEEAEVPRLRQRLASAVRLRGDRLSSGFSGTRAVVRALGEADGGSVLLAALRQPAQPGIGAMLVDGPGTFWETWWIDDDNVGVASLDHIALAAPFAAWAWQQVAGLRATEPGFRRFAVEPRLAHEVSSATVTRMTRRGLIEVSWSLAGGVFQCAVTVPVGSIADVVIPGGETLTLHAGRHTVSRAVPRHIPGEPVADPRVQHSGTMWLSAGARSSWRAVDAGVGIRVEDRDVVCSPVFHESIPAPTLAVSIAGFEPGVPRWIALDFAGPVDLSAASFVFASVDLDGPGLTGRAVRPLLRLTSSDGTTTATRVRPLPIAWNRVTADVAQWPGRASVVRVEVGLVWTDEPDSARGPHAPLPAHPAPFDFRVGRVGWTSAPRTW